MHCHVLLCLLLQKEQGCDVLQREPAARWFDWSFTPRPRSDDRFACQDHYGHPPEFLLALPCPGIVQHFLCLNTDAHAPDPQHHEREMGEMGQWCAQGCQE